VDSRTLWELLLAEVSLTVRVVKARLAVDQKYAIVNALRRVEHSKTAIISATFEPSANALPHPLTLP
jgi:hypothetical protein